ncbi:MAG: RNase adapter RapZ, partial [Blautia sp.]|nr:RNase adapter RapZ [Blautia sp.]
MKFVILTGMSGAGKSTALKMMEDIGFYCVDNLPIPLVEKFVELAEMRGTELQKVAVGIDIRSGGALEE